MEPVLAKAWPEKQAGLKDFCERLLAAASKHEGVEWESVAREGISHSFRAVKPQSGDRPLWMMVDVITGDEDWWLSIVFFASDVTDPDELGDEAPDSLYGETACLFDVDEPDEELLGYITKRVEEAYSAASG